MARTSQQSANPRLTWLLEQLGGTMAVAAALGLHPSTVSRWTHPGRPGTTPPGLPRTEHLLALLELAATRLPTISADWIIAGRAAEAK